MTIVLPVSNSSFHTKIKRVAWKFPAWNFPCETLRKNVPACTSKVAEVCGRYRQTTRHCWDICQHFTLSNWIKTTCQIWLVVGMTWIFNHFATRFFLFIFSLKNYGRKNLLCVTVEKNQYLHKCACAISTQVRMRSYN